jgi:hypothetical protein
MCIQYRQSTHGKSNQTRSISYLSQLRAQISIKQAYGFIQFLEASSCKRALEGEQGAVVRGRKVRKCYGITDYKNIRITLTLSDRS